MKAWERKIAPIGFILAGLVFEVAAALPAAKGGRLNIAFLPIGAVFFILGLVTLRRTNTPPTTPDA